MTAFPLIDQLVEFGLCDKKKLPYARIILTDPHTGIYNMVYRPLATDIFAKITNFILNDQVLYQRLRQLLLQQHGSFSKKAFESLITKAEENNISLDILIEVYNRGINDTEHYTHLSPEEKAFNRLNSFISGGYARELDKDLVEDMTDTSSVNLVGSINSEVKKSSKTLNTIRRIAKEKK